MVFDLAGGRKRGLFASVAAAVTLLLGLSMLSPVAALAEEDDGLLSPVLVQLKKEVAPGVAGPNEVVTYTIGVNCSDLETDCVNLRIEDTIPAPLTLVSVALNTNAGDPDAPTASVSTDGNSFTVRATTDLGGGEVGLVAGSSLEFTALARVPAGVSADYHGDSITNTAFAKLDNRDSDQQDSADLLLNVPDLLAATIDKTVTPSTVSGVTATPVTVTLDAVNTSNRAVDALVIQDPSSASTLFTYAQVSGITAPTWPSGANRVQVDWYNGTTWTNGTPQASIGMPSGVTASNIRGLRFTFTSTTGTIAQGARAVVAIATTLRSSVTSLGGDVAATNHASAVVRVGGTSTAPVSDSAGLTIKKVSLSPVGAKTFTPDSVVGGRPTQVMLTATNGGNFALKSLTITEPATGTPDLAAQGLGFGGWVVDGLEWPVGATAASVRFLYVGDPDFATAVSTTVRNTLPAPAPDRTVVGFKVSFTGTSMGVGQYAKVPYTATTLAVDADVTRTNTIAVDVVATDDQTATAIAADDLTLRTARVRTTTGKQLTPGTIYGAGGAYTIVALPSRVDPAPAGPAFTDGSTVGATRFVIEDDSATFWDAFDLSAIVSTDVPAGTTMLVEYWDGEVWSPLDPSDDPVQGPATYGRTLTAPERAAVQGIRFVFEPSSAGAELPPGFNVQPNLKATLRTALRSEPGTPAAGAATDLLVVNDVRSEVTNPAATPPVADNTTSASVAVRAVPGGSGGGIDLLGKTWSTASSTGIKAVLARSNDRISSTISWGTGGLPFESVTITDSQADGDGAPGAVATTAFDAFDLVSVSPITPTMDPFLKYDRVTAVELFVDGEWVPTASNPCAGSACDGTFPGYVLTVDERAAATSVRLVFAESPTRSSRTGGDPLAPTVGSGVAAPMDRSRQIVLVFEVRDERRSNGEAVLGTTRGTVYNAAPGFVQNTASITGLATDGSTRTDTGEDSVQILDRAINTSATQAWIDGPLGIPPAGTEQAYYPTAQMTLSGQNTSVVKVDELRVAEPGAGTTPFEYLDVTDIVSITVPTGATASTVILHRPATDEGAPSTETLTIAQALALTSADLADVIGIEVVHTGRIAAAQRTTIVLKTRLREDVRSSGAPMTARTVQSVVTSSVTDPAGLAAPQTGTDNTVLSTASASLAIEEWSYGVDAHKYVTAATAATPTAPAIQYVGSSTKATVNLTAQPTGNVRTTRMVIEDSSPTFWNAMNFDGFGTHAFASPINRVQVAVLVGIEYDLVGGELVATCDGSTDLADCWITDPTPRSTLSLPTGSYAKSDIRGIRFIYTRADFAQWDRPFNPLQSVTFTVDRRSTLVFGEDGGSTSPVPSTLYIYPDPAPGETERATFSNEVTVTAALATTPGDTTPLWVAQDTDAKQLRLQHLPARVQVTKAPYGGQSLGSDIPFVITVKNTGSTGDKPLTGVVVVDQLPGDAQGPLLVFPPDPDTGAPVAPANAFAYRLLDAAGVPQTVPAITGTAGTPSPDGRTLTFTMPAGSSIPLGWTLEITATLQFRERLEATTDVVNTVTVTSDQQFDTCDATRDAGVVLPTRMEVAECSTTTLVRPLPSAPMTIIKGVRGVAAGPLDATGSPLLDGDGQPYDDLGVLKTQPTSPVDCTAPSLAIAGEDYYRYPCVPITRPGAEEEWAARFTNSGNVRVGRVVAIDVLPAANDTGVIIADSRGSKWSALLSTYPQLSGAPADATLTVYAATAAGIATARCNGADIQHTMGMATSAMVAAYQTCMADTGKADDVPNRAWSVLSPSASPAELAAVVALKFVVTTATGIAPSEAIAITYRSTTAAVPQLVETDANLGRDSVAYNSIAGAAVGVNGFDSEGNPIDLAYRFVTEPRKVGVALATGQLRLLKAVTGTAASGFKPTSFKLEVSCTSAGKPIDLRSSTGALRSPFTVTAGTELLVRGVPLYASCVVTENTNYGQTTKTISPSTVIAQADQQALSGSTVENPRPAFGTATRPAIPLVTVTNTYTSASLVVSKTVDTGGAAVTYKPSSFTVACTHDRGAGPVSINLGTGNASFTLAAGASRTISNLVTGAVCTVTESNTQGALSTSTIVTQNGSSGTSTTGTSRVITLAPAANTVAFTNAYGIGTLSLRKAVTGAGADTWGNRSFVFAVTCTNPYTATATVFSGEVTLTKSGTDQIGDRVVSTTIPGGSSCSVVETGSGGATAVTTPSAVTVAAGGDPTLVVTNRFDLASVTIAKSVETDAADQQGGSVFVADEYEFDVLCTWQGATVLDTTVVVARDDEETITGLPVGAACDVDELDAFGADSTTMTTAQGSVSGTSTSIAALVAGDNRVAVTNRYGVTAFTVTKQTLGNAATVLGDGEFAMHVRCLAPGGAIAFEDDIALVAGESITIEQLADGSVCSVEETDDGGADDSAVVFDDDDAVGASGVTVTTENPGHATVRNWFLTGAVQVTKVLEGDAAAFATGPFTVWLACTVDGEPVTVDDAERQLVPGAMSTTFTGLPSGAECVLSETERGGASSTTIRRADDATVTGPGSGFAFDVIVAGASRADDQSQPALEVVNSYDRAGLVISKTVDTDAVDADGTPIAYGPFPVEVRCAFEGEPVYAAGYDAEHPMTAELVPGTPWTIDGLVTGATCEVVETDVMDADRTGIDTVIGTTGKHVPGASTGFTLAPSDGLTIRNAVAIDNHYESGSLSIAKAVTGDAADWATAPFTVRVVCELDDATGARTVWDDTFDVAGAAPPVLLEGIASGAACEITETRTGGATSTSIAVGGDDAVAGTRTTLTSPVDATTEVTITNDFAASTVSVTKDRTGASELYGDGPFVVSLACTWQVDGQSVPIAVPGGATRTLEAPTYAAEYAGLPRDAACDLTETRTGGATSSTVSEPRFVLDRADVPITVTNDFAVGAIAVDKTVNGAGAALYGAGPFTVSLECEREVDGAVVPVVVPGGAERVLESASGYTAEYVDLPAGADCLLTETRTGGATTASGPIELSVVADTVTPASLVNTFGVGELRVKNVVTGSAWEPNSHHVFVVELRCTLDVDGTEVELEIPGGAVRDITHLEEIAYLDLPIGALCTLVELQSHGADRVTITGEDAGSTTIDPGLGVELATLSIGDEPVTFDVVNAFELALARTGLDPQPIVLLALLSMLFGAALVVARRRRPAARHCQKAQNTGQSNGVSAPASNTRRSR